MKKVLVLLAFVASGAFAQSADNFQLIQKLMNKGNTKTAIDSAAFTSATIDTSRAYEGTNWSQHFVGIHVYDTASVVIGVQLSRDGKAFGPTLTCDSVVNTANAGKAQTKDISAFVNGFPWYKITLGFTSGGLEGVSSPRYSAVLIRKNR